jgi:hypothetical protein
MNEAVDFKNNFHPYPPPGLLGSAHTPPSLWYGNSYYLGGRYAREINNGDKDIFTYAFRQFRKLINMQYDSPSYIIKYIIIYLALSWLLS